MAKYKQLTIEQKTRIVVLSETNVSNSEISRRIGCSEWTVRSVLKKFRESGSVERKAGSGRKRATTSREEAHLKRLSLRDRFAPALKLRKQLAESMEKPCSTRTVQRRLQEQGLKLRIPAKKPLLTKKMRKTRLDWCKERADWTLNDWERVIFSDESKFNLIGPDGTLRVRRRKGERYSDECVLPTVKHSPYVMVWGAMTARGVGRLIFIDGSVNAKKYKEIIDEGVIPTIEELSCEVSNPVFQDDSAPCHRARSITNYKDELGIESLPWPGNSPDLNPIENLWSVMGKQIKEKAPGSIKELKNIAADVWENEITKEYLAKLYASMENRLQAVIEAKGGHTKY